MFFNIFFFQDLFFFFSFFIFFYFDSLARVHTKIRLALVYQNSSKQYCGFFDKHYRTQFISTIIIFVHKYTVVYQDFFVVYTKPLHKEWLSKPLLITLTTCIYKIKYQPKNVYNHQPVVRWLDPIRAAFNSFTYIESTT